MSSFTILRGRREQEMDVDLEEQSSFAHAEWDEMVAPDALPCQMTIYGRERDDGKLYYIVMEREAVFEVVKTALTSRLNDALKKVIMDRLEAIGDDDERAALEEALDLLS